MGGTDAEVVERPEELTAPWLERALSGAGFDCEIRSVVHESVGTGQMASSYRLTPTYVRRGDAPETLVAKLPGTSESSRAGGAAGAYPNEVLFYRELARTVAIRVPACHHAALTPDATGFTLLLEDLAPASQGDQINGCSPAEAEGAAVNLAGLHGPRWCDPTLLEVDGLTRSDPEGVGFVVALLGDATEQFLERFGERVAGDRDVLRAAAEAIGTWMLGRPERFGLLHGDYRLDNLLFPPDDPAGVAAVDWQTIGIGLPGRDLAYLLGNSLTVDDRRRHEEAIVARYHTALTAHGVQGYSADECWNDYRYGHLQGPLITVLGAMYASPTDRGDDMFVVMATRSCAAIRDLDTLDLV